MPSRADLAGYVADRVGGVAPRVKGPGPPCAATLAGISWPADAEAMTEIANLARRAVAVVVGVDGSGWSWMAIEAAAWEARKRHRALMLVHGYDGRMPCLAYGWSSAEVGAW